MLLSDYQIIELGNAGLVEPFDASLVNPASLDVRIGHTVVKENPSGWEELEITRRNAENPYLLMPGDFALVATLETFNMPWNVAAEFRLKSSRAREGYNQSLAVWLEPNWTGSKLTLELSNLTRWKPLPLYPGLKIGQIVFHQCEPRLVNYAEVGRYNNDDKVMASKG